MEIDLPRKRIALSLKTKVEIGPRQDRKAEAGARDVKKFIGGGSNRPQPAGGVDWFTAAQNKKH